MVDGQKEGLPVGKTYKHFTSTGSEGVQKTDMCCEVRAKSHDGLDRALTITVSPPKNEDKLGIEQLSPRAIRSRRRSSSGKSEQTLVPEEFFPQVGLERTESCLPKLEDMICDTSLRSMLDTSEPHRMVQKILLADDDLEKYEQMSELVKTSYKDKSWREEAAKDKSLIDSLVLLCRQQTFFLEVPDEETNASIVAFRHGRSSRLSRSLSHRSSQSFCSMFSLDRSNTDSLSGSFVPITHLVDEATEKQFGLTVALLCVILKLLGNLCVECASCQDYLHQHRLVDFFMNYLHVIIQAIDLFLSGDSYTTLCNFSVVKDVILFPCQLLKFFTNCVSGNETAKEWFIKVVSCDGLCKLILLTHDSELLACFLHTVLHPKRSDTVGENPLLSEVGNGLQIVYFWLAVGCHQHEFLNQMISRWVKNGLEEKKRTFHQVLTEIQNSRSDREATVWDIVFLSGLGQHKTLEGCCTLSMIFKSILVYEWPAKSHEMVLTGDYFLPSKQNTSATASEVTARVIKDTSDRGLCYLKSCLEEFIKVPKQLILKRFFLLMEEVVHDWKDDPSRFLFRQDCFQCPDVLLGNLLSYVGNVSSGVPLNGACQATERRCFDQCISFLVALTAQMAGESKRCELFDREVGLRVVTLAMDQLLMHKQAAQDSFKGSPVKKEGVDTGVSKQECCSEKCAEVYRWSLKSCLLLLANLGYKSSLIQTTLYVKQGVRLIFFFLASGEGGPFVREAAIFALRSLCEGHQGNQEYLKQCLNQQDVSLAVPQVKELIENKVLV